LDHLLHILTERAIPHFIAQHHRQELGFEGPDLELKRCTEVIEHATSINKSNIIISNHSMFSIQSQSNSKIRYKVDIVAYHCTCLSFPTIHFCKHICAVQNHFPETVKAIPVSALITDKPLDDDDSNIVKIVDTPPDPSNHDLDFVDDMGAKLQELANQFRFHPPTMLSETLHDLDTQLNNALSYF
jgi:hypothetical protein